MPLKITDPQKQVAVLNKWAEQIEQNLSYAQQTGKIALQQATSSTSGSGGLKSVGLSMPSQFSVSNSPLTSDGTIGVVWTGEPANTALMGPLSAALTGLQSVNGNSVENIYTAPNPGPANKFILSGTPNSTSAWGFAYIASTTIDTLYSPPAGWIPVTSHSGSILDSWISQFTGTGVEGWTVAQISAIGGSALGAMPIFQGTKPAVVQSVQGGTSGSNTGSTSLTGTTAGNSVILLMAGYGASNVGGTTPCTPSFTDASGNTWVPISSGSINGESGANFLNALALSVWICPACVGGTLTINWQFGAHNPMLGGSSGVLQIIELTPIPPGSGIPYFRAIEPQDIPWATPLGGVNLQTSTYTIKAADAGLTVVANSGSALTFNLPASPPTSNFAVFVSNIGAGTLTLSPNGLNIDGSSSSLSLTTNQGVYVTTDGSNYYTERGMGSSGGTVHYQTVQQAGTAKPQEAVLNFLAPITATDNPGNTSTDIAVPAFAGGGTTGLVPNPGASPGSSLFLNANGSWLNPGGGGGGVGVDNITHTRLTWWGDPGFIPLWDDFPVPLAMGSNSSPFTGTPGVGIGQLGWAFMGTSSGSASSIGFQNGSFPYFGSFGWENVGTASNYGALLWNSNPGASGTGSSASVSGGYNANSWPLLETSGWNISWVFKFDNPYGTGNPPSVPNVFSLAKKAFYCGLMGADMGALSTGAVSARPDVFLGLRYDTSVTPGTSTSTGTTGNALAGVTTYNISTNATLANGGGVGLSFTVTGFTNAGNNGTFTCVSSTSTTISLSNSGGVTETHAGSLVASGINDSTFQFELVMNQQWSTGIRHNNQGTVFNTSVTPVQGNWYRLDLNSSTQGSVTLTLTTGSSQVSHTFSSIPTMTVLMNSGTCSSNGAGFSGVATTPPTPGSTALGNLGAFPFAPGSTITVSGFTGTEAALNGTWTVLGGNSGHGLWFNISTNVTFTTVNQNGTLVGYPAWQPCFIFGNDDTASPTANNARVWVDYFSFVWNPNLGAGGTPNVNKPRGW